MVRMHRQTHDVVTVPMEETLLVILRIIHNAHRRGVIHHLATAEIIVQIVAAVVCTVAVNPLKLERRVGHSAVGLGRVGEDHRTVERRRQCSVFTNSGK